MNRSGQDEYLYFLFLFIFILFIFAIMHIATPDARHPIDRSIEKPEPVAGVNLCPCAFSGRPGRRIPEGIRPLP